MKDPRVEKLADVLVNYSVEVKPGDWVYLTADVGAMPLVEAVYEAAIKAGGHVTTILNADTMLETFFEHATEDQLKWVSPVTKQLMETADVLISLRAPSNTRGLSNVDPDKQRINSLARKDVRQTYVDRAASGDLRWTLTNYPCVAFAQEANMSLREYEDFAFSATAADLADPVAYWKNVHTEQQRLIDWLKGKDKVTVKGPNIDLSLSVKDRKFINADGKKNMPDGEIFTGPVEESVNGWVKFTYPAVRDGRSVEGVELRFEDGKVVDAKSATNQAYLLSQLDSDEGARYLGEFAIGTNFNIQQFTGTILFDEKIGGTIHMAVGAAYPDTGSKNKSNVHWDFICDMRDDSQIHVDGELFYKNGEFKI